MLASFCPPEYKFLQIPPNNTSYILLSSIHCRSFLMFSFFSRKQKKPVVEVKKPVVEVKKPAVEVKKPLVEVLKPIIKAPKPVVEVPKPVVEVPEPVVEILKPIVEVPKPVETPKLVETPKPVETPKLVEVSKPAIEAPELPAVETTEKMTSPDGRPTAYKLGGVGLGGGLTVPVPRKHGKSQSAFVSCELYLIDSTAK